MSFLWRSNWESNFIYTNVCVLKKNIYICIDFIKMKEIKIVLMLTICVWLFVWSYKCSNYNLGILQYQLME